jgi:hypothetical protein
MSVWDTYKSRITAHGGDKRSAMLLRESRMLKSNLPNSLSYHSVLIDDTSQNVAIINTDNLNEKYIFSLPGENIKHGGLVSWKDNFWLITERDANNTIYTRAKMLQCNHLLRWVDEDGIIREQWCVIEDGTKYLTGEYEDRNFVVTRGDSRIAMTIARNDDTVKFARDMRFLIDDPDSKLKLAYLLTKPLKLGGTYNKCGVFKFVLQEVTSTEDDNHFLGIADYYKYYPREPVEPSKPNEEGGWL